MKKSDAVLYIALAGVAVSGLGLAFTQGWIKNPFEKKPGPGGGDAKPPTAQSTAPSSAAPAPPPAPEPKPQTSVPVPLPAFSSPVTTSTNGIGQGAHKAITSGVVSNIPVVGSGITMAYNFIQGLVGEEKKSKGNELYERYKSLGNCLDIREEVRDGRDGWLGLIPVRRAMMVARNTCTNQELAAETYSRNA